MVFTADTEALLINPNNKSGAMFYRTKLNIHNLTFYILKTKRAMNCLWTEVSGGLVASVSTTIHLDHLEKCIRENPGAMDAATIINLHVKPVA